MPQHPLGITPQHTKRHVRVDLEVEGEIAGHAHRLANLDVGAGPRLCGAERE